MTIGTGIGAVVAGCLLVGLLLLFVPLCFFVHYQTDQQTEASLRWLFFRYAYGQKKPKKSSKKPAKKSKKKPKKQPKEQSESKHSPQEFTDLVGVILDLLSSVGPGMRFLLRHLRIHRVQLQIIVAEQDAAETAISYGRTNATVYGLYATAAHFLNIATPQIDIQPDFKSEEGTVNFIAHARILPFFVLAAAARIGWGFLVKTIQRRKTHRAEDAAQDQKTANAAGHGGNLDE